MPEIMSAEELQHIEYVLVCCRERLWKCMALPMFSWLIKDIDSTLEMIRKYKG